MLRRNVIPFSYGFYLAWMIETMATATIFTTATQYGCYAMGASGIYVGLVRSAFALSTVFGNSFAGWLSDRFSRRRVLAAVMLWNGLCSVLAATAPNLAWYIGARFVAGMFGVSSSLAYSYVGTLAHPNKSSTRYALVGGIASMSFVFMPVLCSFIEQLQISVDVLSGGLFNKGSELFLLAALLSFTASLFVFVVVPSVDVSESKVACKSMFKWSDVKPMIDCGIGYVWLSRLCSTWAQDAIGSTLFQLCVKLYGDGIGRGARSDTFKWLLSLGGLTAMFSQLLMFPVLDKRLGPYWSFRVALMIMVCGIATYLLSLSGELVVLFIAHGVFWVGAGVNDTSIPAVLRAKLTLLGDPDEHVGLANGVANTCKSFSLVLSPLLATWLFAEHTSVVYLEAIFACSMSVLFAFLANRTSICTTS